MSNPDTTGRVRITSLEHLESLPRWDRPVVMADAPPGAAYARLVSDAAATITAAIGPLERTDRDVRRWPADEQELYRRVDWPDFTSRNEAVAGFLAVKAARAALAAAGIREPQDVREVEPYGGIRAIFNADLLARQDPIRQDWLIVPRPSSEGWDVAHARAIVALSELGPAKSAPGDHAMKHAQGEEQS